MKEILKYIKGHKSDAMILVMSLIALIAGSFLIGFLKTILIVGAIDAILFIPVFIKRKKKVDKKNIKKKNEKSANGKSANKTDHKKTDKKEKKKKRKIWKILLLIACILFVLIICAVVAFLMYIVKHAPEFDPEKLYHQEATIVYDSKGEIIGKLGAEKREKITYDEMPEVLIDAIIATEDSRYFQHNGFDLPRFLKASFGQLLGKDAGGASTITMQVVKNHFTSTESEGFEGIIRKFTDIYMSIFKVEKKYTKEEILEFYVNSNYLGGGSYGVEQACLTYFGKHAKDINLAEAAMIAGLFQAPVAYDPYINSELTEQRRKTVLYLMNLHGYIDNEEKEAAEKLTVDKLLQKQTASSNQFQSFIEMVASEVERVTKQSPYNVSMEIYTTMDKEKQLAMNKIMSGETFKWENEKVDAGVMVLNNQTGAIVAIGAGRHVDVERGWNNATQTKRQIGSTAKPLYDYGPGIEFNNWSTYTPFMDEPYKYSSGNSLNNWDGQFEGFMTMRYALKYSRNIPALKAFQQVNNGKIKSFVTSLGLSPEIEDNMVHEAHSIGGYNGESPLTMAAAYSAFANGGYYIEPYSFTKIVYRETGDVYETKKQKKRVMSEETAYMISNMLVDTATYALGSYTYINGAQYGAKTGTTNFSDATFAQYKLPYGAINDLWAVGFNPEYSIGVWYGYDKINRDYVTKMGNSQHSKLFQTVGKSVFTRGKTFKRPNGVVEVEVEKETYPAQLPSEFTPKDMIVKELFKKGTEPTDVSTRYAKLESVKNLNSATTGRDVTLTWDAVKTPDVVDEKSLTTYFKKLYSDEGWQKKSLSARLEYNKKSIGEFGYYVYEKNADGSLKSLGFTKTPSYKTSINSGSTKTYVVKSGYSIFKANQSDGAELKVDIGNVTSVITAQLNGEKQIELKIGDRYYEPSPMVIVLDNLTDVSDKALVEVIIERDSDQTKVDVVDTSVAGSYTVTYNVTYQDYTDSFTRKVIIS